MNYVIAILTALLLVPHLPILAIDQAPKPLQAPPIPQTTSIGCDANCDCSGNCPENCTCPNKNKPQYPIGTAWKPQEQKEWYQPEQAPTALFAEIVVTAYMQPGTYQVGATQVTFTDVVQPGTYKLVKRLLAEPSAQYAAQPQQYMTVCSNGVCRLVPVNQAYRQQAQPQQYYYVGDSISGNDGGGRIHMRRAPFKGRAGRGGSCCGG